MLKSIHLARYEGQLDEAVNKAFIDNNITRDNLVSVEYSTRVMHVQVDVDANGNPVYGETWFASALIVYEETEGTT